MASEQVLDIPVRRHVLTSERPFQVVLDGIFGGISQPDIGALFTKLAASTSYEEFSALVRQAQGSAGLMRFLQLDLDTVLPLDPLSAEMITVPSRDWRQLAACRHADPELFFPVSMSGPSLDQITQAKAICVGCPVRRQCLGFALDTRQNHGVWGGMSEQERGPGHGRHLKAIQAAT